MFRGLVSGFVARHFTCNFGGKLRGYVSGVCFGVCFVGVQQPSKLSKCYKPSKPSKPSKNINPLNPRNPTNPIRRNNPNSKYTGGFLSVLLKLKPSKTPSLIPLAARAPGAHLYAQALGRRSPRRPPAALAPHCASSSRLEI